MQKAAGCNPDGLLFWNMPNLATVRSGLALTCLEATLGFIDDVYAAFAAHDTAIAVPALQRAERVADFHCPIPYFAAPVCALETVGSGWPER